MNDNCTEEIEEWFRAHGDDVYSFLAYYTGTFDVDDLVQETFIRAMKGRGQYQGNASPKTWLRVGEGDSRIAQSIGYGKVEDARSKQG